MKRVLAFSAASCVAAFGMVHSAQAATCNEILKDETPVSLTEGDPSETVIVACGGETTSSGFDTEASASGGSGGSTPPVVTSVSSVSGGGASGFGGGGSGGSGSSVFSNAVASFEDESVAVALADATDDVAVLDDDVPAVPLPASGLMLLAGLGGIAAVRRRRKS